MARTTHFRTVEVCLEPALFKRRQVRDNLVIVVADILRATSAICTAVANGAVAIIPVTSLKTARRMKAEGFFVAAERGGVKPSFADAGNSPFDLGQERVYGKKIAYTTTNGTRAIKMAEGHGMVVLGSFLNLKALSDWLTGKDKNVLILCAGWEGTLSLEDALFAGELAGILLHSDLYTPVGDEVIASVSLRDAAGNKLQSFASKGSHYQRLQGLGLQEDLDHCFRKDPVKVVPVLKDGIIVKSG